MSYSSAWPAFELWLQVGRAEMGACAGLRRRLELHLPRYARKAALFFFSYMMMVTFIIMNLFVGVVISSLQTAHEYLREKHLKQHTHHE